jgi:hypothetical protein
VASTNETSASSRHNRTSSAKVCTSQVLRSSATEDPVIRPSTRRVTAFLDDSTTVTLSIAVHPISYGLDKAIDMPFRKPGHDLSDLPGPTESTRANIYLESVSCEGSPPSVLHPAPRKRSQLSPPVRRTKRPTHHIWWLGVSLVWEELRWTVTRCLDAELTHTVAKRVWMKVQHPRRALWTIHDSTGMLKGSEDMVSVHLVQR